MVKLATKNKEHTSGHEATEALAPALTRRELIGSVNTNLYVAEANLYARSEWYVCIHIQSIASVCRRARRRQARRARIIRS